MNADDLRAYREEMHWSQTQLAKRLGISPWTVRNWEQGRNLIPTYLILALCALAKGYRLKEGTHDVDKSL